MRPRPTGGGQATDENVVPLTGTVHWDAGTRLLVDLLGPSRGWRLWSKSYAVPLRAGVRSGRTRPTRDIARDVADILRTREAVRAVRSTSGLFAFRPPTPRALPHARESGA